MIPYTSSSGICSPKPVEESLFRWWETQTDRLPAKLFFLIFGEILEYIIMFYRVVVSIVLWTSKIRENYSSTIPICFLFIAEGLYSFTKMEWFSEDIKLSKLTGTKKYLICGQSLNESSSFTWYNINKNWFLRHLLLRV